MALAARELRPEQELEPLKPLPLLSPDILPPRFSCQPPVKKPWSGYKFAVAELQASNRQLRFHHELLFPEIWSVYPLPASVLL